MKHSPREMSVPGKGALVWLALTALSFGLSGCFGFIGSDPSEGTKSPWEQGAPPPARGTTPSTTPPNTGPKTVPPSRRIPPAKPDAGPSDQAPDKSDPTTPPLALACELPPPPLQRITREMYRFAILDLFNMTIDVGQILPSDNVQDYGFARAEGFSVKHAKAYMEAAELVASKLDAAALSAYLPCQLHAGDEVCAKEYFQRVGRRLFRRPMTAAELDRALALFRNLNGSYGFTDAIRVSTQFFLQSPHFLYRVERGAQAGPSAKVLQGYEIATRLAAVLWQSVPDEALLLAAHEGKLSTRDQIEAQARRLLADERAKRTIHSFFVQWLHLEHLDAVVKDKQVYPGFNAALAADMKQETMTFIDHVMWQQKGSFKTLLTARYSFLNERLAKHYGISGVTGPSFRRVEWKRPQRIGILTQGSMMTAHANIDQSSPIHRGVFVRKRLLCGEPKIPDGLEVSPPAVDPNLPTRERFEKHREDPNCAGCHAYFDPIGFGFEHFDGIGRFRENEGGRPVDARGELVASDIDGMFTGPAELAHKLASSAQAQQCFVKHWFRFAMGRRETASDACLIDSVHREFVKRGTDIRELLVLLVTHPLFRYAQGKVPQLGADANDPGGASDTSAPLTAQTTASTSPTDPVSNASQLRGCSAMGRGPSGGGILWFVVSLLLALFPLMRRLS